MARDPVGFARVQWDTWSPAGWYEEAEFAATAEAFAEPDFVPTTLHYYRVRWGASPRDPAYERARGEAGRRSSELSVPTLLIHGGSDTCIAPEQTEGLAGFFTAGYRRVVVPGAGHFVPREAPGTVADLSSTSCGPGERGGQRADPPGVLGLRGPVRGGPAAEPVPLRPPAAGPLRPGRGRGDAGRGRRPPARAVAVGRAAAGARPGPPGHASARATPRCCPARRAASLLVKDEGLNPTGSFKARGAAVGASRARELGARHVALPTNGNAGAAWSAYGRRAGLAVTVAVPAGAPAVTRSEALATGAGTAVVDGLIGDAGAMVARAAPARDGWFDVSTLKEPYRVEGKKTMGLEIAEQLGWRAPDVVVYPTGGGVGLIGIAKAFAELRELGWLTGPATRFVAAQSSGCAPVVRAFEAGAETTEPWPDPRTVAYGITVAAPLGGPQLLRILRGVRRHRGRGRRRRRAGHPGRVRGRRRACCCPPRARSRCTRSDAGRAGLGRPGRPGRRAQHRQRARSSRRRCPPPPALLSPAAELP